MWLKGIPDLHLGGQDDGIAMNGAQSKVTGGGNGGGGGHGVNGGIHDPQRAGRSSEVERSLMVRWVLGSILHGVNPLSYFSF